MENGPYKRSSENTGEILHGVRAVCKTAASCKVGFDSHLAHTASVVKRYHIGPLIRELGVQTSPDALDCKAGFP
jgi:hypothetical protein